MNKSSFSCLVKLLALASFKLGKSLIRMAGGPEICCTFCCRESQRGLGSQSLGMSWGYLLSDWDDEPLVLDSKLQ